jgi:imidazolonepropionase-like amidohydrolase
MKALCDEAHLWNRKVCAHAHGTEAIKVAVRAGVSSIEHGSLIDAEGIQLMKDKGVYLVADIYNDDYEASKKISLYSASIPPKDEAHMRGIAEGARVSTGCWIGETVSLRYN